MQPISLVFSLLQDDMEIDHEQVLCTEVWCIWRENSWVAEIWAIKWIFKVCGKEVMSLATTFLKMLFRQPDLLISLRSSVF